MKRLILLTTVATAFIMNTSSAAISRLKSTESFSAKAYPDGYVNNVQKYSIGYGHQIGIGETALRTQVITVAYGVQLMQSDIHPLEIQINRDLKTNPTQNQFDALISFGYNEGSGALGKIITLWNSTRNTKTVTDKMLEYDKTHKNGTNELVTSPDLAARRRKEIAVFNSGLPPVPPVVKTGIIAAVCFGAAAYFLS
ncbi:lysozyme [Mucilaginibacter flavus]|uniref:lysozyme n=1 Tax=Mucilaginibacter flavus TaxID=931504 RepID=UPI0025B2A327|nr:lysozyme [Mucilaginibacter flavus]MDN3584740.1 lysozyme [Mucilaginibacter flavus]